MDGEVLAVYASVALFQDRFAPTFIRANVASSATTDVKVPAAGVVAPTVVPLIEPPVMVAPELDNVLSVAVDDAVSVVKAPVDAVVAPRLTPFKADTVDPKA